MKKIFILSTILLAAAATLPASEGAKKAYLVNTSESAVNWIGSKPAGEHNGTVSLTEGTLTLNQGKIAGGKFILDMNSIKNFDLESAEWNKKLVDHLKGEDFFHTSRYPTSVFEITKAEWLSGSDYRITGVLTMKQVSKSISFKASILTEGNTLTAKSEQIILDRTEWKVEALSKSIFADLKDNFVDDEIKIVVNLRAEVK